MVDGCKYALRRLGSKAKKIHAAVVKGCGLVGHASDGLASLSLGSFWLGACALQGGGGARRHPGTPLVSGTCAATRFFSSFRFFSSSLEDFCFTVLFRTLRHVGADRCKLWPPVRASKKGLFGLCRVG